MSQSFLNDLCSRQEIYQCLKRHTSAHGKIIKDLEKLLNDCPECYSHQNCEFSNQFRELEKKLTISSSLLNELFRAFRFSKQNSVDLN
jgi:hypothetical protein